MGKKGRGGSYQYSSTEQSGFKPKKKKAGEAKVDRRSRLEEAGTKDGRQEKREDAPFPLI